jgi:hypothetical protein
VTKPARDYEKLRPAIMRAISLGSTPERICAKHMLHWPTLMRRLAKWKAEDKPAPVPILLPDADEATAFVDHLPLPIKQAASMATKEHDPDRNERIRQLRRDGLTPAKITRRLGLSRNIVIGVLNRAGMLCDAEEKAKANREGAKVAAAGRRRRATSRGAPPRSDDHAWNFSANAHRNAAIFGKGHKGEATGPINLEKHYEPIPSHAVTIEHVTGCRWPFGDVRGEGIAYCNKPRCSVKVHHMSIPITTAYCVEHWDIRRCSKNTRVIADNMQRLNGSGAY